MTSSPDLAEELSRLHFLADIPDEYLQRLASISRLVEHPPQRTLFREGEPAIRVYLLLAGSLTLEICAPAVGCKRICTLSPGDLVGWSPVLEQARLTATARTVTAARLIEIDATQLLALCEHDPRFGYEIMRRTALALAKRLNATRLQLVDVYGSQLPPADEAYSEQV